MLNLQLYIDWLFLKNILPHFTFINAFIFIHLYTDPTHDDNFHLHTISNLLNNYPIKYREYLYCIKYILTGH